MSYFHNVVENDNIVTIYLQYCYHSNRIFAIWFLSPAIMVTKEAAKLYGGLWLTIYINRMIRNIFRDFDHIATVHT